MQLEKIYNKHSKLKDCHSLSPHKQMAKIPPNNPPDTTPLESKEEQTFIWCVIGSLLYYDSDIEPTIMNALSDITEIQAKLTIKIKKESEPLLDFMASHTDTIICYQASDMVLWCMWTTPTCWPPRPKAMLILESLPGDGEPISLNMCCMCFVSASETEDELGELFLISQQAKIIRLILTEFSNPLPTTPIHCDNTTT